MTARVTATGQHLCLVTAAQRQRLLPNSCDGQHENQVMRCTPHLVQQQQQDSDLEDDAQVEIYLHAPHHRRRRSPRRPAAPAPRVHQHLQSGARPLLLQWQRFA